MVKPRLTARSNVTKPYSSVENIPSFLKIYKPAGGGCVCKKAVSHY